MGLEEMMEWWPTVHKCCGCVGLRTGVVAGAAAGCVTWGAAHVTQYALLEGGGALRLAHGALGVLVVGFHALAAGAAWARSRPLLVLFLCGAAAMWVALLALAAAATVSAARAGDAASALAIPPIACVVVIASLYHSVVVANFITILP